jgi:hypothetical protein
MDLLCVLLRYFPACLRQQSGNVETLLVARMMDAECHASLSQKCAKALSLLPKAHGDAGTWSALLRRILIAINAELDFAFLGMEDGVFNFLYGCLQSASSVVPCLGSTILHSSIFLETII